MRRNVPGAIALAALLALPAWSQEPEVRIESLEIGPSSYNGPGRIFRKGHPARFQITLINKSDLPRSGWLAAEVVGNLETVYGLAAQRLDLKLRERRAIWLAWDYPGTAVYEAPGGQSVRIPGPRWGHQLNVAWRTGEGRTGPRWRIVFGIATEGFEIPAGEDPVAELNRDQAFRLRYSGYLRNNALAPIETPQEFSLKLAAGKVRTWRRGSGPTDADTCLAELEPCLREATAVLEHGTGAARLLRAWLLEPARRAEPRATKLRFLSDLKLFRFAVPAIPQGGLLLLELGPSHFVPPVSLEELAKRAEEKFGEFPSLLGTADGKPIPQMSQLIELREQRRRAIRQAFSLLPAEPPCPLAPRLISEETVVAGQASVARRFLTHGGRCRFKSVPASG
jgi:hypothetical protein